jgi:nucleoside-diphosphate-sugar epimerase
MDQTALIGYTGFVGGNILSQRKFTSTYNTSNIDDIDGKSFDLVVSAATYAEMWKINQDPQGDLAQIDGLIAHLRTIQAKQFVLISTVGVYKDSVGATEDTPITLDGLPPYGVNRYHLEQAVRETFPSALIVRLPGLFGPGLKKNVIFDLLHNNNVDRIHHAGSYQYYNLGNICHDIKIALDNHLALINFATEPVRSDEIADYCFGIKGFNNQPEGIKPAVWDMRSQHADLYGGHGGYLYSKQQVLDDIKQFVIQEKAKLS